MAPAVLDESGFDAYVSQHDTVVVGFLADEAAVAAFPRLASLASAHPRVAFASVAAGSRGLFDMFGLDGPALAIFRQRIVLYLVQGLPKEDDLARLLDRVATLDIEQVKREIEQERAARESLAVHRVCPTARRGNLP